MTDTGKGRVLGVGGIFFRPADLPPAAFTVWSAGGATVLEEREEHDFGRFGWFIDPDGHRVELWEPPEAE